MKVSLVAVNREQNAQSRSDMPHAVAQGFNAFEENLAAQTTRSIPDWVDKSYAYDPEQPRKPKLSELMEVMSGKTIGDLYLNQGNNWQELYNTAADLLYGVVGSNLDRRDWGRIMSASDVVAEIRDATKEMYEPSLMVEDVYDYHGKHVDQYVKVVNNEGHVVRTLDGPIEYVSDVVSNFGVSEVGSDFVRNLNGQFYEEAVFEFLKNLALSESTLEISEL